MLDVRIRNLDEFRNYRHPLESTSTFLPFLLFPRKYFRVPIFPDFLYPCFYINELLLFSKKFNSLHGNLRQYGDYYSRKMARIKDIDERKRGNNTNGSFVRETIKPSGRLIISLFFRRNQLP